MSFNQWIVLSFSFLLYIAVYCVRSYDLFFRVYFYAFITFLRIVHNAKWCLHTIILWLLTIQDNIRLWCNDGEGLHIMRFIIFASRLTTAVKKYFNKQSRVKYPLILLLMDFNVNHHFSAVFRRWTTKVVFILYWKEFSELALNLYMCIFCCFSLYVFLHTKVRSGSMTKINMKWFAKYELCLTLQRQHWVLLSGPSFCCQIYTRKFIL